MFTNATKQAIQENFCKVSPFLMENKPQVIEQICNCTEEQQILMKFLYAAMPISDIADYDFDTYLRFANHALFLKENMAWCAAIPDDIFLNNVLFYRINNEDIEECRKLFYDWIYPRIAGKSMQEAALEVNAWCSENAAYQSTDERTASPLTVWRNARGRCGEESTFTVAALRSVGIPARQIYTPRWSHCDDNHAWVEVWCDGNWHYLGACEPEPVLDKGWFTESASRAMLIHSMAFSPIISHEEVIGAKDKTIVLNRIRNYAAAQKFTVHVIDEQGNPALGAVIEFEVLNESEFFPIASKITDESGKAEITLGIGDIHIHVRKEGQFTQGFVNTAEYDTVIIQLEKTNTQQNSSADFKVNVPEGDSNRRVLLTQEQKEQNKQTLAHADKIREEKISAFYREQEAEEAVKDYPEKEELKEILYKAKGNFQEVKKYLNTPVKNDNRHLRVKLLCSLTDKDYGDLKAEILLDHFQSALRYCGQYEEDIFVKYLMCPRAYFERMTPYRAFISAYFDRETKSKFQNNPRLVWDYVLQKICTKNDREYEALCTSPQGLLQIKHGSMLSKKILFIAVCRTIGVPARINPMTLYAEYYQSGKFVLVEKQAKCGAKLAVRSSDQTQWLYKQNWSVAILENGAFHTLDLSAEAWVNSKLTATVPAGQYRLLVSNRMPNGSLLGREYRFIAENGKIAEVSIALPEAQMDDLLEDIRFTDFQLINQQGRAFRLQELVKDVPTVVIWLEQGKEPTEHILNELIQHYQQFNATGGQLLFIVRNQEALLNVTLQKTLRTDLNIALYYGDFTQDASTLARSLYHECEKFPLVFVTRDGLHAIYSCSGYNVGTVDLLAKIIKATNG
jgi:5-hydroxyisourate hydrolase-like protein (transthyretin family)